MIISDAKAVLEFIKVFHQDARKRTPILMRRARMRTRRSTRTTMLSAN